MKALERQATDTMRNKCPVTCLLQANHATMIYTVAQDTKSLVRIVVNSH